MMSLKGCGRKQSWPKVLSQHFPGHTEENHEKTQYNLSLGRDLNPRPAKYVAGVLTTRRSVRSVYSTSFIYISRLSHPCLCCVMTK
jgi:hypothetical protein